jgi:hypothetical protein
MPITCELIPGKTAQENSPWRKPILRPEYDFASLSNGVRGKHYEAYRDESEIVLLDPDLAKVFPTEGAVNKSLRSLLNSERALRRDEVSAASRRRG